MKSSDENPIALAVIGGTGLYKLAAIEDAKAMTAVTPYGMPSGPVRVGQFGAYRIAFLARHGEDHGLPPHKVNYRANLWLLKQLGATRVLAVNAVGGITERYAPRAIGVPDQIIDYTWGRISTFCEESGTDVLHVDMTEPYARSLRAALLAAARAADIAVVDGGCYGATQGPRLETKAEIARLRRDGCDLVGMTGMPEAGLARELGLDYASLALVANWAAGCGPSTGPGLAEITMDEVHANLHHATAALPKLIVALVASLAAAA
ncbi:MAG TPA: S-methyl-5'-thioinosine phosphorylase [Xanthomonadaceae bacterium]|nr:S-methyl-5'-thioinosine phosphorylase [Xanthomonadaceae bacterium]